MQDAQTQTESRDLEVARLRAKVAYLKHALAYADNESMRKRSESAAMEELVQCQRRGLLGSGGRRPVGGLGGRDEDARGPTPRLPGRPRHVAWPTVHAS